jgi:hypothetical protein
MGLFKYLNFPAFIISLIVGFFIVYITMPDSRIIYVYPTPENVSLLQYKDKTDTCFSLEQTEVKCPMDTKNIIDIPIQT